MSLHILGHIHKKMLSYMLLFVGDYLHAENLRYLWFFPDNAISLDKNILASNFWSRIFPDIKFAQESRE